jgi:hypothetical protein
MTITMQRWLLPLRFPITRVNVTPPVRCISNIFLARHFFNFAFSVSLVEVDPYPASRDEYQARLADFTSQEKRRFDTIKSLSAYL